MKHTITFFSLSALVATLFGFNFGASANQNFLSQALTDNLVIAGTNSFANEQAPAPAGQNELSDFTVKTYFDEQSYLKGLEDLDINLHPGTNFTQTAKSSPGSLIRCKTLVYRTLKSLPPEPVKQLRNVTLNFSNEGRRGMAGADNLIIRCINMSDSERAAVLTHEIAHVMDIGVMQGHKYAGISEFRDGNQDLYLDDPSVEFYRLSFSDEETVLITATDLDFVSGYAMTDPFEDFAESYAYYILHGNEFRALVKTNKVLQKKYEFLKTRVFNGNEYFNGDPENELDPAVRNYDVTVLPYNLNQFLII